MSEIGKILKEERLDKGYTLDDLQQITKIQKKYLDAIEKGEYNKLPGNFYTRAFIKQYADIVGLDGDQLIADHPNELPQSEPEQIDERITAHQSSVKNQGSNWASNFQSFLPTLLIIALVLAVVVFLYTAFMQGRDNEGSVQNDGATSVQITSNSTVVEVVEDDEETSAEDEAEDSDSEEATGEPAITEVEGANIMVEVPSQDDQDHTVAVEADGGETWVAIATEGATLVQGLVANGENLEADIPAGTESVQVTIGNAPASLLIIDGSEVDTSEEANTGVTQYVTVDFVTE